MLRLSAGVTVSGALSANLSFPLAGFLKLLLLPAHKVLELRPEGFHRAKLITDLKELAIEFNATFHSEDEARDIL